jgi:hypothetical protein
MAALVHVGVTDMAEPDVRSDRIALTGSIDGLAAEDARRLAVYVVRCERVLAAAALDESGRVRFAVSRQAVEAPSAYALELVVGPGPAGQRLPSVSGLRRLALDEKAVLAAATSYELPLRELQLSAEVLHAWWLWCAWYCVSGTLVGQNGCPVPGAEVTVYNVHWSGFDWLGKSALATVTTDANGRFTACFPWCRCPWCCWPCWPIWWECWPWWWEWDILHVIDQIEAQPQVGPIGPGPLAAAAGPGLQRPEGRSLLLGQGFASRRAATTAFAPDPARTATIRRKLNDARIRALFPWWWWCCDLPNILFSAVQGGNVVLDESPWTNTRWCLANDSSVTLVAGTQALTVCPGQCPPAHGFVWTRVGATAVNAIHGGYADGVASSDSSDMAFAGTLDIYGEFANASNVAYYQVEAGQWAGDPSRGGTPPAPGTAAPISSDLINTALVLHPGGGVSWYQVKMGPFSSGLLTNLYATQEQRPAVPAALLPPFPALGAGDTLVWVYDGRKVDAQAVALVGGAASGAVTLTVTGYDVAFSPVALPHNVDDSLTLTADSAAITTARIDAVRAYTAANVEVAVTTGDACPAYDIGPGGHVEIDVTAFDAQGHIFEYEVEADFGHGSVGSTTPGLRGYRQPGPYPALPYQAPDVSQKSFSGGTETIRFQPTVDCCYDFRLIVGKRVTDGTVYPSNYTADFQTVSIKVSS